MAEAYCACLHVLLWTLVVVICNKQDTNSTAGPGVQLLLQSDPAEEHMQPLRGADMPFAPAQADSGKRKLQCMKHCSNTCLLKQQMRDRSLYVHFPCLDDCLCLWG